MAITKILNIMESEGRNPASYLKNALEYIQNPDKTEECVLAGGINCLPDTAFEQMQLHEDMRKAGFYIKTVEESCERFAVIDQKVVWYGNINLLAKTKVDDSIMRVLSNEIAGELLEITFGNNS